MFGKNIISIEESCFRLANQLNEWYQEGHVKEDILDFENNKGLVLSLCLLAGVLVQERVVEAKPLKAYSQERMAFNERAGGVINSFKNTAGVDSWLGV